LPIETLTALNARRIEHIVDHLSAVEDARIDHLMQRRRVADCGEPKKTRLALLTQPLKRRHHIAEHLTIPLTRLERRAGAALVERVTGGKTLPKEVADEILARTDGVPLFIEELTKTVLESALLQERNGRYVLEHPLPSLPIPTTLQASLMARLDRLAPVREVAQIGAVAGREFHYELLYTVTGIPKERLEDALEQLVRSELIFRRGENPHAVYTFKHTLVRDAAYASLLKSRRAQLHAAIANALEQQFLDIAQTQPETLAYHLTEAGLSEKAIEYWLQASKNAALRSANLEAIAHLRRGIELMDRLPKASSRVLASIPALHSKGAATRLPLSRESMALNRLYAQQ
jgi:predicted ATPase